LTIAAPLAQRLRAGTEKPGEEGRHGRREGHRTAGRERARLGGRVAQGGRGGHPDAARGHLVWIKEFQATVENDRVKNFRVTAKVSFVMERS
jgi:hypothetical protein